MNWCGTHQVSGVHLRFKLFWYKIHNQAFHHSVSHSCLKCNAIQFPEVAWCKKSRLLYWHCDPSDESLEQLVSCAKRGSMTWVVVSVKSSSGARIESVAGSGTMPSKTRYSVPQYLVPYQYILYTLYSLYYILYMTWVVASVNHRSKDWWVNPLLGQEQCLLKTQVLNTWYPTKQYI